MIALEPLVGPVVVAAAISGLISLVAIILDARRLRREAARRRLEREGDLRIALAAEIEVHVEALRLFDLDEQWRRIVGRMEAEPDYGPTVPSERNDAIFSALLSEVQLLPEGAIGPVVRYYSLIYAIGALIGDLRSDLFRSMGQAERIAMYTDYIALKKEALALGEAAVAALRRGRPRGLADGLSSRASGRSAP